LFDVHRVRQKFGASIDRAQELVEAKTLTITKLMDVVPVGTQVNTPFDSMHLHANDCVVVNGSDQGSTITLANVFAVVP